MDAKKAALTERTRDLLLTEALPYAPGQVCAGPEHNHHSCAICEEKLREHEIVYEVDIERRGEKQTIYLHPRCHELWQTESVRLRRERKEAAGQRGR